MEFSSLFKLIEQLSPVAYNLVKSLVNRLQGASDEEVAAIAHAVNAAVIADIDEELANLPPKEDPPAEEPPVEDPPAEEPPVEDPPVEEDPAEEEPPVEEDPAEEEPEEEDPAGQKWS